ncbi:REP element-mobilizing transposase RayT [Sporomusa malonica]|uniref:REP element-mobilizing transposase RayT n=2 Tax=Sporomusa malonica TaxID=112901 RepID=A0A1W1YBG7_9FIRM|nr:REP element-mobilizing transposase RayT [Sporomusa malonica]
MVRGNERKPIFNEPQDKDKLIDILLDKKRAACARLYAFCIMDNHAHFVVREDQECGDSIETLMKRIGVAYATYYNQKQKRVGHVFQDRYRSEPVEDEAYLLSVIRYVHNNPQKAGDRQGLAYPWSSYGLYVSEEADGRLGEIEEILEMFHANQAVAKQSFQSFHLEAEAGRFLDVPSGLGIGQEPTVVLQDFLAKYKLTLEDMQKIDGLPEMRDVLWRFMQETGLSVRKIAEIAGINRERLRKIVMSKEPSP